MPSRTQEPLPPPPDIEPLPTEGFVRFLPYGLGREIAAIGGNVVGSVEPQHWGRMPRTAWRCNLFDDSPASRADNAVKARIALLRRIADWHDLAGPLYAAAAREIRRQADGMTP